MFKQKTILFSLFAFMIFSVTPLNKVAQAQLDDPTRPPGHRLVLPGGKNAAVKNHFILSSVRISSTRHSAIINNRSVEVGDTVNGARVIAIYLSAVKLKKRDRVFTVKLVSQVVKKTRVP